MRTISNQQVIERLREDNPWWQAGEEGSHPSFQMRHRAYLSLFLPLVTADEPRRAVVLLGPRRVGKTVILHQTIRSLIESGVPPKQLCYVNLEVPTYNGLGLEDFLGLIPVESPDQKIYVFFDEIQYLKGWETHLKTIVDSRRNVKCVASGSAAAALRLQSNESGAGRFTDFLLPPVTFYEFLELKELRSEILKEDDQLDWCEVESIERLNEHFVHYLNFGGYPEVIFSEEIQKNPGRFIRSDIIDKVLLRDLPSLYGIQDIQELNSLFTMLAYNTANEVSLEELSQNSGVAKNTIKRYIEYLESAFLIKTVHRVDESARRFKRANFFKVYLTNPCMRSALFSPLPSDHDDLGHLVETGIFAQWFHSETFGLHYARWRDGEVDIVQLSKLGSPYWAVEVKWTDRHVRSAAELKSLRKFLREHKNCEGLITTKTWKGVQEHDGREIEFVPASVYCYALGRNIIRNKGRRKPSLGRKRD